MKTFEIMMFVGLAVFSIAANEVDLSEYAADFSSPENVSTSCFRQYGNLGSCLGCDAHSGSQDF